jgi:hypothetical protein
MEDFTLVMKVASGVPVGAYEGEFSGVEPVENDYGNGLKWSWKITKGEQAGRMAIRTTGNSPTPKNACGKILNALTGKTLGEGESFKPKDYVGRKYTVMVTAGEKGGTRVETVAKM